MSIFDIFSNVSSVVDDMLFDSDWNDAVGNKFNAVSRELDTSIQNAGASTVDPFEKNAEDLMQEIEEEARRINQQISGFNKNIDSLINSVKNLKP